MVGISREGTEFVVGAADAPHPPARKPQVAAGVRTVFSFLALKRSAVEPANQNTGERNWPVSAGALRALHPPDSGGRSAAERSARIDSTRRRDAGARARRRA